MAVSRRRGRGSFGELGGGLSTGRCACIYFGLYVLFTWISPHFFLAIRRRHEIIAEEFAILKRVGLCIIFLSRSSLVWGLWAGMLRFRRPVSSAARAVKNDDVRGLVVLVFILLWFLHVAVGKGHRTGPILEVFPIPFFVRMW